MHILIKAGVKLLCCSEANDGVDDSGSIDRCTAINDGDDNSILLTIVARKKSKLIVLLYIYDF